MSAHQETRTKIASVKSIQKITQAMRMVAASKMRKAQDNMEASRPYSEKILEVIAHLASAHPEYKHEYMTPREIKRVGIIVLTTDRGLCGALNINILRETMKHLKTWKSQGIEADLCLVGNKADAYFKRLKDVNIIGKANHIHQDTELKDFIGTVKIMLNEYEEKRIDALYLTYSEFVNSMTQKPVLQPLLPIESKHERQHYWDYIYEPGSKKLLNDLLKRYIESQVYQSAVEMNASEQAARIVAMMNATDNATQLIDELKLIYNKARQAAITQEISEIVAGAVAT